MPVSVVGVSADDVASPGFCNKFSFTIDLPDPNHELLSAAEAAEPDDYKALMYWNRTSFCDRYGRHAQESLREGKPEGHERVLLDDIKAMQAE